MAQTAPSGQQWTIRHGDQEATVVQVGGGLREYTAGGRPVLFGYPLDAKADAGRGQLLMPWPNRVRDGRFTFEGKEQQLALTEPALSNASHGLVRWALWEPVEHTDAALTVAYSLLPQQGWDYPLDLQVRYELTDDGLVVTPEATATGAGPAPFAFGAHPYLTTGEDRVDELELRLPADTVLTVDERLIPTGTAAVPADLDFRTPRAVGDARVDHAYTDLAAHDGRWEISVAAGGLRRTLWAQADAFGYAQVFTGDSLPPARARRTGVAVEPMTAPANALATGEGLIVLQPGERWTGTWGVRPS